MNEIIGREEEQKLLQKYYETNNSELIILYGRRRVGKTYLIENYFKDNLFFYASGVLNEDKQIQITNFLRKNKLEYKGIKNWNDAFYELEKMISGDNTNKKKVIFLDEIAWFEKKSSSFLRSLEYFWNSFCNKRKDILLILCSSASSWVVNKIINNKGGLYNRISGKIIIKPFTLKLCEKYLEYKNIRYSRVDILEIYMILGGIPYYLNYLDAYLSVSQNIDKIFFSENAHLKNEFSKIFSSLFENNEKYKLIIETLAKKTKGLSREAIIKEAKLESSGYLSRLLDDLEQTGFIRKYNNFSNKKKDALYQLIDNFSLFYNKIIYKEDVSDENYWSLSRNTPKHNAWKGYSFEMICFQHINQIKIKLGISGILSNISSFQNEKCQIDLIIKRADNIINLCEIKNYNDKISLNNTMFDNLHNKIKEFERELSRQLTIHLTLISVYGLEKNKYSNVVTNEIILDDLFCY
ncbi:MAG: ATP-binding protein [Bacillales bacterium]|nr:ATP-binding protein [Bacillales bacterium]